MSQSSLALAEAEALAARARLNATLGSLQERLDPKTLARNVARDAVDTGEKAARVGADAVLQNPGKTAGLIAVLGLFFARKTIVSVVRKR